jgi:nicotinamide-nucleotide adenylyltransferase
MKTINDEYGVVHGRFQPLHNGHVHYILEGLKLCDRLIIAVTNADPTLIKPEESDIKRGLPSYNPFTFFERYMMIEKTLIEEQYIKPSRFMVTTLPIHDEDLWKYYLPPSAVLYVNVTSEWDSVKLERMQKSNFKVKKIGDQRFEGINGTQIRQKMIKEGNWSNLVPKSVESIINSIAGVERLKRLSESEHE